MTMATLEKENISMWLLAPVQRFTSLSLWWEARRHAGTHGAGEKS